MVLRTLARCVQIRSQSTPGSCCPIPSPPLHESSCFVFFCISPNASFSASLLRRQIRPAVGSLTGCLSSRAYLSMSSGRDAVSLLFLSFLRHLSHSCFLILSITSQCLRFSLHATCPQSTTSSSLQRRRNKCATPEESQ